MPFWLSFQGSSVPPSRHPDSDGGGCRDCPLDLHRGWQAALVAGLGRRRRHRGARGSLPSCDLVFPHTSRIENSPIDECDGRRLCLHSSGGEIPSHGEGQHALTGLAGHGGSRIQVVGLPSADLLAVVLLFRFRGPRPQTPGSLGGSRSGNDRRRKLRIGIPSGRIVEHQGAILASRASRKPHHPEGIRLVLVAPLPEEGRPGLCVRAPPSINLFIGHPWKFPTANSLPHTFQGAFNCRAVDDLVAQPVIVAASLRRLGGLSFAAAA
jgi:hypothetical protein